MLSGFTPRPLKRLFTANQCWTSFLDAGGLRDIEVEAVTKMLACGTRILGVKEFGCDNPDCHHVKYLTNSCGSRACPSCGKKATDLSSRQPGGCKLKTAPVRPVVAARPAEYVCSENLFYEGLIPLC